MMYRRFILSMAALGLSALAPLHAAAAPAGGNVNDTDLVRSVDLDGLVFPIMENRQLKNYLFVSARLRVAPGLDAWAYRAKGHLIRDAIILAAHQESFHVPGNIELLDLERVEDICLKAANNAIGEDGALVKMIFIRVASKTGFIE